MSEWQLIEDMPEEYRDGREVLLCGNVEWMGSEGEGDLNRCIGAFDKYEKEWHTVTQNPYFDMVTPTHWAPLMDPPKEPDA